jgi:hypothetical protein
MPSNETDTNGSSGNFQTTSSVCYVVMSTFNTWRCYNLGGRSVTVNGTPAMCSESTGTFPLPARIGGAYYFEFTGGGQDASFVWYTQ